MINLILGTIGAGKSYEAVVFHIIPAIKAGRRVITNMPLQLPVIQSVFGDDAVKLIKIIMPTNENPRPFSTLRDYEFEKKEGLQAPLFVIDECYQALPRLKTPEAINTWYSMSRHEGGPDILLISQGYRKISADIVDLVQLCYKLRKNIALGSTKSYVRKVQDGVRGAVVNETIRTYKKQWFQFYKSQTESDSHKDESNASDVKPIWRHWSFYGALIFLPLGFIGLASAPNPLSMDKQVEQSKQVQQQASTDDLRRKTFRPDLNPSELAIHEPVTDYNAHPIPYPAQAIEKPPERPQHPLSGYGVHVLGYIETSDRYVYQFGISQNGQLVYMQTMDELMKAGYEVVQLNDCMARLEYDSYSQVVHCDSPKQQVSRVARMDKR